MTFGWKNTWNNGKWCIQGDADALNKKNDEMWDSEWDVKRSNKSGLAEIKKVLF